MRPSSARYRALIALGALLAVLPISACGGSGANPEAAKKLAVTVAFAPIEDAARAIGGDRVSITDLTPIGGEPSRLVPTAAALDELKRSKVVLYLGGDFQPAVSEAVVALPATVKRADLLAGIELRPAAEPIPGVRGEVEGGAKDALSSGEDPHVWLDPVRLETMATQIEQTLTSADPNGKAVYHRNAERYRDELRALDAAFRDGLAACTSKVLLTTHAAFGYLAERYGLTQAATAGIAPDDDPDPASLAATERYAKRKAVTTLFFDVPVPPDLAETVARKADLKADTLGAVEGRTTDDIDAGATYFTIQRRNLARLQRALGCSAG